MHAHRPGIRVQAANRLHLDELRSFVLAHGSGTEHRSRGRGKPVQDLTGTRLLSLIDDRTVLGVWQADRLVGIGAICLGKRQLLGPLIAPDRRLEGLGTRLLVACERLAATFQLYELEARDGDSPLTFLARFGYRPHQQTTPGRSAERTASVRSLSRRFTRRRTDFGRRIADLCRDLGIPADYGCRFRLPLQPEATQLVEAGTDVFGRVQRLTPKAAAAWTRMKNAAGRDRVQLDLVSAFRSVDYQSGLLRKKIDRGIPMRDILAVSAAPGFSEHHSGNALDLTTPGSPVLEAEFANTTAFAWLQEHGADHGFYLSFPADNRHGVLFEPWHWCHAPARVNAAV